MDYKVEFEFLFVGREEESFVKNYFYELDEPRDEGVPFKGKIFINFEMMNNISLGEEIGELIFRTAKTHFFKEYHEDPYNRFEEALKAVNHAVALSQEEKQFQFASNLNVIIGAIVGDELFVSQRGDAEAYLVRRRHVTVISEGLSEGDGPAVSEVFQNIASGTLEKSDTLIFSTTRLLRHISKTELGSVFSEGDLPSCLEDLKEMVSSEISKKTGILGIHVRAMSVVTSVREPKAKGNLIPKLRIFETMGRGRDMIRPALSSLSGFTRSFRRLGRERILAVLVVVAVILVVGVVNMRRTSQEKARLAALESSLAEVQTLVTSAETKGAYDKKTAGVLLSNAEAQALEVLNSGFNRSRASQFLEQIQSVRDQLDNVIRVKDPRVYADLSVSGVTLSPKGLILAHDVLYVYTDNQLLRVVLNQVDQPVRIDETEMVVSGSYFEDRDALVFLMKSGRVVEYQDNRFSFMDTDDGKWKGGVDIAAYSNKLYILSPQENQIWRYVRRRDKYGAAEAYTASGDFKDVLDLAIDGSVYALKKTGGIFKFYAGEAEDFVVNKEPITALSSPTKIFTDLDLSQVYVLEPSQKRILVFNKDQKTGNVIYNAQYVFDFDIADMAVEKMSGKMYLLAGSKIYEAGM